MSRSVGSVQQRCNSRAWEKTTSNGETPEYQNCLQDVISSSSPSSLKLVSDAMLCFVLADVAQELDQMPPKHPLAANEW